MVGIKVQSCPTPSPEFMRDDTLNRSDDRILDYGELMVCKLQGFPVDRAHRRPRLLAAPHMKAEARDTRANTITNALLVSLSSVICEVKLWASTSGAILAGTRKRATKQYTDDVCRKFTWESFFQTQTAVTFENTKPAAQQVILRQTHHAASQQYLFFKSRPQPSTLGLSGPGLVRGAPEPNDVLSERDGIGGPKGPDAKHHPVPNKGLTLRAAVPPARLLLYVKMIPKASILEFPITPH
ncbi:hypothetical protein PCASD_10792 [Puccinia coronata f. sp. avenae]|uniref:Uncharacterized protein n=1 Tax=Puccinia coronata f. sp. avenae TaxID=200324 RepID=A0A2N5ULC6_9BASI|nr:hypothetical protein PCASD_10792 [Puccinia coronata f. sp. avenae]